MAAAAGAPDQRKDYDEAKNAYELDNADIQKKSKYFHEGIKYFTSRLINVDSNISLTDISNIVNNFNTHIAIIEHEFMTTTTDTKLKEQLKEQLKTSLINVINELNSKKDNTFVDQDVKPYIERAIVEIQSKINKLSESEDLAQEKSSTESKITDEEIQQATALLDALCSNREVKQSLASAVATANKILKEKTVVVPPGVSGGTQRVGTKKRKRRKRRGKGTGKNKPLSEVNVVL